MRILSTYNIKGGVGKTATAVNLAYLAAREGFKTLLWDLDPQGAASFYFGVKTKIKGGAEYLVKKKHGLEHVVVKTKFGGVDVVPADFSYRNMDIELCDKKKPVRQLMRMLRPLSQAYNLLFIDCPPNITLVSENVFFASDALLVPVIPTPLSLRTHEQLLRHFRKTPVNDLKLLPFFSMVDRRRSLHRQLVESVPLRFPGFMKTEIPYASQVEQMGVHCAPLPHYAARSYPAKAYEHLWDEIKRYI